MGHTPIDAEWYIADLVMEITVHGAQFNIFSSGLGFDHARSPDEGLLRRPLTTGGTARRSLRTRQWRFDSGEYLSLMSSMKSN